MLDKINLFTITKTKPLIMGVLNVTPDSFSDGGKFNKLDAALVQAETMIAEGADIIDVGGESTRPNATPVSLDEELERVIPVVTAIAKRFSISISIDTSNPLVMEKAVAAGATFINDVRAFTRDNALQMASKLKVPIGIMHMQGEPSIMQNNPSYKDVVLDVTQFLKDRIKKAINSGVAQENIVVDPGFGFGKKLDHNLTLLNNIQEISKLGCPVLVGLSRKSMLGQILDLPVDQRLFGSVAANVIAFMHGANIFRVHDVAPTVQALKIAAASKAAKSNNVVPAPRCSEGQAPAGIQK